MIKVQGECDASWYKSFIFSYSGHHNVSLWIGKQSITVSIGMEFICILILALLAADAVPVKQFPTLESVNFDYSINTPMYYYYVPYLSPYWSSDELIDPAVSAFQFEGSSGMEYKQFLSDRTMFGLFTTSDLDSVEIYASPFQELINRVFFAGQFRPNRLWSFFTGNKPVSATGVSSVSTFPGILSGSTVDNENESVIIEV